MKSLSRIFRYLAKYPALAAGQLACATTTTLAAIIFPEVTKRIINTVVPEKRFDELLPWVLLALAGFLLRDGCNALRILLNNNFEQKVIFDLRARIYARIQLLPVNWFDTRRTGDVMTRVIEDVTSVERVLIDGIEQGIVAILQIVAVTAVLWWMNPELAAWACLPLPFLALGAWLYTHNASARYRLQRSAASEMNSLLHDNIAGIRQIKAYTAQDEELDRFNSFSSKLCKASLRIIYYWAAYNPSMSFVSSLGYVLILGFGGMAVMKGQLNPGEWVQYFLLIGLLYDPVGKLHQLNQMLLSGRAAAERVFEIIDSPQEPNASDGQSLPSPVHGDICFKDVNFSYGKKPTLSNISFRVNPGQTVALVGHTGSGKSTILSLLTGFYPYHSGSLSIDGHEVSALAKNSLREAIGYVTQEAYLFNGSVRDNLLLGKPSASDSEIWAALDAANASPFVSRLPEKLDTNVGERGVKLSGGEKQRLSIARALLKNPPILLLDEATASVDSSTERLIQQSLDKLMQNRTSIVIAHRLSTIQNADVIHVLDHGKIVESGTHAELLALNGTYAALAQKAALASSGFPN